jgi:ADP-ribose pyrophosphatase YjhB (NUDIX family)
MVGDSMIILTAANVVIVNEKNEVLLQQRSDSGLWGLPGGLMELDDSIEQCAIREAKEELGIDVELTGFLGVFTNPMMRWRVSDKAKVICFSFTAKIIGGELKKGDHETNGFGYFAYDQLPTNHANDNIEAIEAYYHRTYPMIEGRHYQ